MLADQNGDLLSVGAAQACPRRVLNSGIRALRTTHAVNAPFRRHYGASLSEVYSEAADLIPGDTPRPRMHLYFLRLHVRFGSQVDVQFAG